MRAFRDNLRWHVSRCPTIRIDIFVWLLYFIINKIPARLNPKSMILRFKCLFSNIFSGLISRWVIFISWRYCTASRTCLKINFAYFSFKYPSVLLFIYWSREFPPPYSIIKFICIILYVPFYMFILFRTVL
jgi:hypothetical protein